MKPPIIRIINPNRRAVFREVVAKLKTLEARMVALRITPEIESMILPHHAGYIYLEERELYRCQLETFRAMQSRKISPKVTPHTIALENFNVRVGPGKIGEYHATVAMYLAVVDLQGECNHGPQWNLAESCVAYWRETWKTKLLKRTEHIFRK